MLVRADGVARADGDADQRFVVGDDGGGCGAEFGGDGAGGSGWVNFFGD